MRVTSWIDKDGFHTSRNRDCAKYKLGDTVRVSEDSNGSSPGQVGKIIRICDAEYEWIYRIKVKNGTPPAGENELTLVKSKQINIR